MNTETLDKLEALLAKADILPLEYKPDEYDDWGTIRAGKIGLHGKRYPLCQTRQPYASDEAKAEHRKSGTDPYEASARLLVEALNALPTLLSIARRAADVEAIRAVTAKASSEWTGPNPAEFATGVAFVTKPHFVATAVSRYVMGETTPVSIADIGDDEEVGR